MRRLLPVIFCALLIFAGVSYAQAPLASELMNAGDAAYLKRSENLDYVRTAISKWEQAYASNPDKEQTLEKIAMAYYYLGRFAGNEKQGQALFQKGYEIARKAVEKNQKSAGAHFWWGVNLAKSVEEKGRIARLTVLSDVVVHLTLAQKLDPKYFHGGPDRALGLIVLRSPVPKEKLAISSFRKSLEYAPDFAPTMVLLGEALYRDKKEAEARPILEKVLTMSAKPGWEREMEKSKKEARALLDEMGEGK